MSLEIDGRAVSVHDFLSMHMNRLSEMHWFQDSSFFLMFEPNGLLLKNGLLKRVSGLVQNQTTLEKWLTLKTKPFSKV
jgi:hypothetical protein